jgi:large subunit ribosomal protein L4
MDVPVYRKGKADRAEVDVTFLGEKVLKRTLRDAVIMYEANRRAGTHSTLNRGDVARAKKPLFPQKHTGRARVKHPQVTQCRGGGIPHGPRPRDYSYAIPRKALGRALGSALLAKFQAGSAGVVDGFGLGDAPKTATVAAVLDAMKARESCLVVIADQDAKLVRSARNLPRVAVRTAKDVNAFDVAFHRSLILTEGAIAALKERLAS